MTRIKLGHPSNEGHFANLMARIPHDPAAKLLSERSFKVMTADCEYEGNRFRFFIDVGELDYTAYILRGGKVYTQFKNGPANDYEGIVPRNAHVCMLSGDPLDLLTTEERNALETWLIGE